MQENTSTPHMCSSPLEEPPKWESEPDQIQWTAKGPHYSGMNSAEGV